MHTVLKCLDPAAIAYQYIMIESDRTIKIGNNYVANITFMNCVDFLVD